VGPDRAALNRRPAWLVPALAVAPVVGLAVFYVWPLGTLLARVTGAGAIGDALASNGLARALWFTTWQALASTLITLIVGFAPAYVLARYRFAGRRAVLAVVTVPFMLPTVVVGAAFLALLPDSWHGSARGVILAHVFFNIAVVVRLVGAMWAVLPSSLTGAARTLGASPSQVLRHVVLPLLRPALWAAATVVFLFTFTSFGVVRLLGGPANPTIEDVARHAGVSTATVSRVLNQTDAVREALRARVETSVAALGYVPHAGARTMKLRRSGTLGAIFPTIDNAIFAKAIDALQRRLAEAGHQLLIATSDYDPRAEERQALTMLARGVDGLLLCGCGQDDSLLERLRARGVPAVHVMSWPVPPDRIGVGFDNTHAMGQVVKYLVDLGHRRIALLAGVTRDNDRATARARGVREALAAAGLDLPASRLVERRYGIAPARDGLRQLMAAKSRPTAIVCGNDVLAFGALLEAQRLGIAVPRQLSIVGFDDLELASHIQPSLTTVRVPADEMWRCAADRVLAALNGEEFPRETEIDVALVVRESSGPPPRAPARKR